MRPLSRRDFLGASAAAAAALAAGPQETEPIIDIHQHTDYGGRRDKAGNIVEPGRYSQRTTAFVRSCVNLNAVSELAGGV